MRRMQTAADSTSVRTQYLKVMPVGFVLGSNGGSPVLSKVKPVTEGPPQNSTHVIHSDKRVDHIQRQTIRTLRPGCRIIGWYTKQSWMLQRIPWHLAIGRLNYYAPRIYRVVLRKGSNTHALKREIKRREIKRP